MLKHMEMATDQEKVTHALPYEFLLTKVFEHFIVPLRGPKKGTKKDMFDDKTLNECDCVSRPPGTRSKTMVTNLLEELATANDEKEKM